jgi:hypothetical protein
MQIYQKTYTTQQLAVSFFLRRVSKTRQKIVTDFHSYI